jgi:hypothetical protein
VAFGKLGFPIAALCETLSSELSIITDGDRHYERTLKIRVGFYILTPLTSPKSVSWGMMRVVW